MESLLKEEYFHFGTDKIYQELWHNVVMPNNIPYSKPLGGLWTSHQNEYSTCEWLEYIENKNPFDFDLYVGKKKSCLVKFNENTKFLKINDIEDFKNLKQSGFIKKLDEPIKTFGKYDYIYITEILDYEKIMDHYDLIYINRFIDECFRQFSINTMLALNPSSIEYYKPLVVDYLNHKVIDIGEKEEIKPVCKGYYEFLLYVRDLIKGIKAKSYEEFVLKINNLKEILIKDLCKNYNFQTLQLPKDLDTEHLVYSVVNNEINKKIKKYQKNLHN